MNECIIYWIVIGCLSSSALYSVVNHFIQIRNSESAEKTNIHWCDLINTICTYGTYITMYANRWFAQIYKELYYQYDYFFAEFLFLLIILFIWIITDIPSSILYILTNKKSWVATKNMLCDMLWKLPYTLLFGGYIILVYNGLIWAMIPAVVAIMVVGIIIWERVANKNNVLPVKMLFWFFIISIIMIGWALLVYSLSDSDILSIAMDIYYPMSYVANLLSVVFISLPLIDIIQPLYKKFEPQLYVSLEQDEVDEPHERY